MVAIAPIVLAASGVIGLAQAAPNNPLRSRAVAYKNYKGNGSAAQGWPTEAQWASFDTIWNTGMTSESDGACKWLGVGANSAAEKEAVKAAIKRAAAATGLDERFLLVAAIQESAGCVRVKSSTSPNDKVHNPGLYQSAGKFSCNDPEAGIPLTNPCPTATINGMVDDGVGLTPGITWGFKQLVPKTGATDVSKYYKASVLYNSGVLPADGNLGKGRSNACYASDIANRLMGWIADESPCDEDTIGNL